MIRAEPVEPSRDRVLGFVLIFSDITDRKAAETARSRFQEGIIKSHRINSVRLDSKTDLVYQNLLSSVVENAQLAALEITYGVETGRIAEMLESVRNSTLRTAEVLEHLIWHSSRTSGGGDPKKLFRSALHNSFRSVFGRLQCGPYGAGQIDIERKGEGAFLDDGLRLAVRDRSELPQFSGSRRIGQIRLRGQRECDQRLVRNVGVRD